MRSRGLVAVAALLGVLAAGLITAGLSSGGRTGPPEPPQAAPAGQDTARDGARDGAQESGDRGAGRGKRAAPGTVLPESDPVRVSIPSLGVDSALERLGRQSDGAMETPQDPGLAGWYTPGPAPGEQGPAVISGHVTWNGEQAVFYRLGELGAGDRIEVAREDGRTAEFAVDRVARYPKADFPTLEVYGNLDHAGLRLITCGGDYDPERHYYSDNVVVFASLTGASA
ncbi:class F sortase [Streptomyces sp. JJ36]|uniref:class F sortase n=1 Tax=Streptomyces sp. JJ36 TaxID=2736645 RepID=UPI001F34B47F|nr:class F sortase [Streptomyces sp. JJ36]MCF6526033.1 class F sortase [Streptomyces sp. JJ36]